MSRLRASVQDALTAHGIAAHDDADPASLRERLNDLYLEEVRRLKGRRQAGAIAKRDYASQVEALRDRFPLLSLPLSLWVDERIHRVNDADAARRKAETTYNSAADRFDSTPLAFWARYGRRTVERLKLGRGARVLDVCCGSGASAIPAAEAVGPEGSVLAVDLADQLLDLGRAKARDAGHTNLEFRRGDMGTLEVPRAQFDAVVCVFGIFFVPDMEGQLAELMRFVAPGGQLAITTWGPRMFEPGSGIWRAAVARHRPDLSSPFNPWDRITTPEALRRLFADAGVPVVDVAEEEGHQLLRSPEDFWTVVLGSGYRWVVDQMGPQTAALVHDEVLADLAAAKVDRIQTNVIYGTARASAPMP